MNKEVLKKVLKILNTQMGLYVPNDKLEFEFSFKEIKYDNSNIYTPYTLTIKFEKLNLEWEIYLKRGDIEDIAIVNFEYERYGEYYLLEQIQGLEEILYGDSELLEEVLKLSEEEE